jgi:effector-binding domain-containing protein
MPTTKERPATRTRKPTTTKRSTSKRAPTKPVSSGPMVAVQTRAPEWGLAICTRANVIDIPPVMGQAFSETWAAAERLGLRALMPFARYFAFEAPATEFEPPQVEFEAGFLVDGPVDHGEGRVAPVQLPGGEVAAATHVGPYQLLSQTYEAMQRWIAEQGRTASGPMWEVYLDDPETTPVDQLRTEVVIPLV